MTFEKLNSLLFYFFIMVCTISFGICDEIETLIYSNVQSNYTCFRRFNATHQTGCSSNRLGNTGTAFLITSNSDLEWLISNGTQDPYVLLLTPDVFSLGVLTAAQTSNKITGIVLLSSKASPPSKMSYSPDSPCPNKLYDSYADFSQKYHEYCDKNPWNPNGSNLLFMDWKFPILLVQNETDINALLECFNEFNKPDDGIERPWPLCGIEMNAFMYGAQDTKKCIRRSSHMKSLIETQYCDPIGGYNIYYPVNVIKQNDSVSYKSITVIAARLDSASMFDGISPGADSAITGVVSLLLTAHFVSKYAAKLSKTDENVVFLLFNGESFDYIGSSKFVYDLSQSSFPVKLDFDEPGQPGLINTSHIKQWIEISQVNLYDASEYYIHSDPLSRENVAVDGQVRNMSNVFEGVAKKLALNLHIMEKTPLLPASFHSMLKYDSSIPGLVLANHKNQFINRFYHSIYDDSNNLKYNQNKNLVAENLIKLSKLISISVLSMILNESIDVDDIPVSQVTDILDCYLISPQCTFWESLAAPELYSILPYNPLTTYVSVYHGRGPSHYVYLTHHSLAYLTGEYNNMSNKDCKTETSTQALQYIWLNNASVCLTTSAIFTPAISPAFSGNFYNESMTSFSSWTESTWVVPQMRMYLYPSRSQEIITLVSGIIVFFLSFLILQLINSRSHILFLDPLSRKDDDPSTVHI